MAKRAGVVSIDVDPNLAAVGSKIDRFARTLRPLGLNVDVDSKFAREIEARVGDSQRSLDRINTDKAQRQLVTLGDTGERQLGRVGSHAKLSGEALIGIGAGSVVAGTKILGALGGAVDAASSLNEVMSFSKVVFSDSADAIDKWGDTAAEKLGQSKREATEGATTFATFGKSAGLAGNDLVGFSTRLVKLAADMASAKDTSPEEAISALGAALRGETEPIRQYGVLLDDATLRQEALHLGITKTTKDALTPQQKVLATNSLLFKQTKDIQGDLERTSGSLANTQRRVNAEMEDTKAKAGKGLVGVLSTAETVASSLINTLDKIPGASTALGVGVAGVGGAAILGGAATSILGGVRALKDFRAELRGTAEDAGKLSKVSPISGGLGGQSTTAASNDATAAAEKTATAMTDVTTASTAAGAAGTAAMTETAVAAEAATVALTGTATAFTALGGAAAVGGLERVGSSLAGVKGELLAIPARAGVIDVESWESGTGSVQRFGGEVESVGSKTRSLEGDLDDVGTTGTRSFKAAETAGRGLGTVLGGLGKALAVLALGDVAAGVGNDLRDQDTKIRDSINETTAAVGDGKEVLKQFSGAVDDVGSKLDIPGGLWKRFGTQFRIGGVGVVADIEHIQQAFDDLATSSPKGAQAVIDAVHQADQALDHNSTEYIESEKLVKKWQRQLDAATKAQEVNTGATTTQAGAMSGLGDELERLGVKIDPLASKWTNFGTVLGGIFDPIDSALSAQRSLADGQETVAKAQKKYQDIVNGNTDGLKTAAAALRSAREDLNKAIAETGPGSEAAKDALHSLHDAIRELHDAQIDAGRQPQEGDFFEDKTQRVIDAFEKVASARKDLDKINSGQSDQVVAATDRLSEAQQKYNEELGKTGPNSQEAADALKEVTDAEDALPGLVENVEIAEAKLRDELEKHPEAIQASIAKVDEWVRKGLIGEDTARRWKEELFKAALASKALNDSLIARPQPLDAAPNENRPGGPARGGLTTQTPSTKPPTPTNHAITLADAQKFGPESTKYGFPKVGTPRDGATVTDKFGHVWTYNGDQRVFFAKFALGGIVPDYPRVQGVTGGDVVPAMLTPGEGVLTTQAVSRVGPETVHALNAGAPINADVVRAIEALQATLIVVLRATARGGAGEAIAPILREQNGLLRTMANSSRTPTDVRRGALEFA